MNEAEILYVNRVWADMPTSTSFFDAFLSVVEGNIPAEIGSR
jgi:hypothetical protein